MTDKQKQNDKCWEHFKLVAKSALVDENPKHNAHCKYYKEKLASWSVSTL